MRDAHHYGVRVGGNELFVRLNIGTIGPRQRACRVGDGTDPEGPERSMGQADQLTSLSATQPWSMVLVDSSLKSLNMPKQK